MVRSSEKPRWQYRFDNYKRAYTLLREAIEMSLERELSQLEKEGIIQRFEYTLELAWKTIKDYLESQNVILEQVTPRFVIKEAIISKLLDRGDIWMEALDARNKMSRTYDFKEFESVIEAIRREYLSVLDHLYFKLLEYSMDTENA